VITRYHLSNKNIVGLLLLINEGGEFSSLKMNSINTNYQTIKNIAMSL